MDKRQQKSQKIIMDAFVELLKNKEIEKISMHQIAEKANVNRGTIYLNFVDKYDLLNKSIEVYFVDLITLCRQAEKEKMNKNTFLSIFRYLSDNFDMIHLLFKHANFSSFNSCIFDQMLHMLKNYPISEVKVQFIASAITGVLIWWIKNAMPCSPDDISEELWDLLHKNLPEAAFDM